jgi:hypothetical protein
VRTDLLHVRKAMKKLRAFGPSDGVDEAVVPTDISTERALLWDERANGTYVQTGLFSLRTNMRIKRKCSRNACMELSIVRQDLMTMREELTSVRAFMFAVLMATYSMCACVSSVGTEQNATSSLRLRGFCALFPFWCPEAGETGELSGLEEVAWVFGGHSCPDRLH